MTLTKWQKNASLQKNSGEKRSLRTALLALQSVFYDRDDEIRYTLFKQNITGWYLEYTL